MGNRERKNSTYQMVFSSARPVLRQLPAAWLTGVLATALFGIAGAVVFLLNGDLPAQARINAQQDAAQQRGLRLRQNLLYHHVGAIAKTVDDREDGIALMAGQNFFACGRSINEYTPCRARKSV
jgi:hypothetical protein